jgi:hypothetical protein
MEDTGRRTVITIFSILFVALLAAGAVMLAFTMRPPSRTDGVAHAASSEPKVIKLSPGHKLEGISWACASGGYCTPTWLTRPMRPGETPETHRLENGSAYDVYVFIEQAAR